MNKQEAIGLFKLTPMTQEKYDKDLDNANGTDVADVLAELYVELTEKYDDKVRDIQKSQRDLSSVYDFKSRQKKYGDICRDVDSFIRKDMFSQPELMVWIVNTFLDNFFKVVLPVLYRGLISQRGMYPVMVIPVYIIP